MADHVDDLAQALSPLECAEGFIYHGEVLGEALPHVAEAIINHLTAAGWRPPPSYRAGENGPDHVHIAADGIWIGGREMPGAIDPAGTIYVRPRTEARPYEVLELQLAAVDAISIAEQLQAEPQTDGRIAITRRKGTDQ